MNAPSRYVRLQKLRDFTVQIRHHRNDQIVGTGIAVSMAGQVVTCAHVFKDATGLAPREARGAEVGVYFPQVRGREAKAYRATVAGCFAQHDDDVVLLQLTTGATPLGPEQIAVLGYAEDCDYHPFRTYGYRPFPTDRDRHLAELPAGHGHGTILGCVDCPEGYNLLEEPVMLESQHLNQGMSGAAVLDTERNLVVGIISETWLPPRGSPKDRDTGWAVNARVLSLEGMDLPLRDEPLDKRPAPQPQTDVARARSFVAADLGVAWNNAPPLLPEWTGRTELLAALDRDWADPERRVTGLIGFGGEGKSSLARQWVENLLSPPSGDTSLAPGRGPGEGEIAPRATASPPPQPSPPRGREFAPDGIFWWGFYEKPSVDEFFEAALEWLGGGRIDVRRLPGSGVRAQVIGAMLGAGRYLFVLDGLEVMQHQDGDAYGLFRSADLRTFLELFAAPGHPSFCLLTSRAPALDLMDYTTYTHRDVERLSPGDGRALLRNVGVTGPDAALDRLVADWDGHALTLGLLGSYLADRYGGDVRNIDDLPPPTADEPRYQRVHRVLRRYDEHLSTAERAFLTLFSAFRTPVQEEAFDRVFRTPTSPPLAGGTEGGQERGRLDRLRGRKPEKVSPAQVPPPPQPSPSEGEGATASPPRAGGIEGGLAALGDAEFAALVKRLVAYRLLRHDAREKTYTAHPLVRNHYFALLTAGDPSTGSGQAAAQDAHTRIKDYYLAVAGDTPHYPTLDDLAPLIEVVHHACRAGAYDEAWQVYWGRIQQSQRGALVYQLGAWETDVAVLTEFFNGGDTSQEPQVSKPSDKSWILNEAGLCLMSLGRLGEAAPFYERHNAIKLELEDWHNASAGYQNLAELHAHLGALAASAEAARQALALARRAENKTDECYSLKWQAWADHLRGDLEAAGEAFQQAEALEQEIYSSMNIRYLFSLRGIQHADHLRRMARSTGSRQAADYARRVTEANLEICVEWHWPDKVSMCHRALGDLDADEGNHDSARAHYDQALKIARGISDRSALIEALLARGRWAARYQKDLSGFGNLTGLAFSDLDEALGYALEGGYRIYEADLRVALAWAHLAAHDAARAKNEAERARQLSVDMGYHWGQVDAAEVLAAIGA